MRYQVVDGCGCFCRSRRGYLAAADAAVQPEKYGSFVLRGSRRRRSRAPTRAPSVLWPSRDCGTEIHWISLRFHYISGAACASESVHGVSGSSSSAGSPDPLTVVEFPTTGHGAGPSTGKATTTATQ